MQRNKAVWHPAFLFLNLRILFLNFDIGCVKNTGLLPSYFQTPDIYRFCPKMLWKFTNISEIQYIFILKDIYFYMKIGWKILIWENIKYSENQNLKMCHFSFSPSALKTTKRQISNVVKFDNTSHLKAGLLPSVFGKGGIYRFRPKMLWKFTNISKIAKFQNITF